jgi:tetratricopeptide (TPR) repeat protein
MATALCTGSRSSARRREILEWHAGLRGKGPAQVLGLSPDADPAAVKAAFVALAKRFHPDTLHEGEADLHGPLQEVFIRITEAYRDLQARQTSRPARPETRPVAAQPSRAPNTPRPSLPASRPAPALDPEEKHRRVAEALRQAAALIVAGDTAAAVGTLHEVLGIADGPERRSIRLLLSRAYVSAPQWRRYGVALLGEMLHESPRDADALTTLGALYHGEGLLARAEATLRRALDSDPGHAEARAHLRAVRVALDRRRAPEAAAPPEARSLVARLLSLAR